jgi:hypothetical protein
VAGAARLTAPPSPFVQPPLLAPRPDDQRGLQIHRVVAVPAEDRVEFEDTDSPTLDRGDGAFPLPSLEGGSILLSDDRHRAPALTIVLVVVKAGVAVAKRRTAVAAAGIFAVGERAPMENLAPGFQLKISPNGSGPEARHERLPRRRSNPWPLRCRGALIHVVLRLERATRRSAEDLQALLTRPPSPA